MKHFALFFFLIFSSIVSNAQAGCTYSDQGSNAEYSLNAGEVLCIESGIFTGTISSFDVNAEIRVAAGATFQPSVLQNANGLINNKGVVKLSAAFILGTPFSVINDSGALFQWNVAQTFTGPISLVNRRNAEMDFFTTFDIPSGSDVLNEGMMIIKNGVHIQQGALLSNECVFHVYGDLSAEGVLFNSGLMKIAGFTEIGATAFFTNKCSYYGKNSITNLSMQAENYGYMHIYGADADNTKFINNAYFYMGDKALLQCHDFDNNSDMAGSGKITASHLSRNFGTFGADAGGLNFYDMSPSGIQIFDVQTVAPDLSVSANVANVYDTTYISENCSQMAFPDFNNVPLPVVLNAFETTAPDCIPHIYWQTAQETNSAYFELERKSDDGLSFEKIATVEAAGFSALEQEYTYIDANLPNGHYQYRLRIVDLDGRSAYSRVSQVQVFCGNTSTTNIWPNPATDYVNIGMQTNADDVYEAGLYDISGRLLYQVSREFNNGFNSFSIPLQNLTPGIYCLKVSNQIKTESFKFLKN